ncbi:signal peptide peptidase SppA [Zavarzinia sp. CC-PAN008]|uniref:signal peptide peptidase SppA n=1 Tax=Zavarzinia sp. CC-PAN008 TaxID=3243332 RepID=UPI003F744E78
MAFDADAALERRRLRRSRGRWRLLAVAAVGLALVAGSARLVGGSDHIARIKVEGLITDDAKLVKAITDVADDPTAKALILQIDSGGGTTVGGEVLFNAVRTVAAEKPVVSLIGGTGASAAYLIAIAGDHVLVRETSITGSIGVLFQQPDVHELLAGLGIEMREVKSSPLKAAPSPFQPWDPAAEAVLRGLIDDTYGWFRAKVADRRKLDGARLDQLANGQIFTGRQAVANGLVDAIGGEDEAKAWLEAERDLPADLPVRSADPKQDTVDWLSAVGAASIQKAVLDEWLTLDGLRSVWQR